MNSKEIFIQKGLATGKVQIGGDLNTPLNSINGNIELKNGYISNDLQIVHSDFYFDKNVVRIKDANAKLFGKAVSLNGLIYLGKKKLISMNANMKTIDLNIGKIKFNDENNNETFKLPSDVIDASLKIDNVILKDKNRTKTIKNVYINIKNNESESSVKASSENTRIIIVKKGTNINVFVKDYAVFSFLTKCGRQDNLFNLKARLTSAKKDELSFGNLKGKIDVFSENGEFKNVSNSLKFLSATNIIELIIGKTKMNKHLPYKKIIAPLYLKNYVLKTRKNELVAIYGNNLNIFAEGKYNLKKSYINIYATFTTMRTINNIVSSIPIIGWVLGGKEKSFTGVNFHIKGFVNKKISVKPVPLKSLGKGFFSIIKRALTLPFNSFGVGK